jgi:outer membrane protein OmpA-like peptidoglycan-associated protein
MKRLAIPFVILLLLLGFAGVVWALFVQFDLSQIAYTSESETTQTQSDSAGKTAESQLRDLEEQLGQSSHQNSSATFDVARIDPEGTSVFAGRAKPGDSVTIVADGEAIGTTEADANGEWTVAIEHRFASNDPELSLRTGPAAAKTEQKVARAETNSEASEAPAASAAAASPPGKGRSASEVTTRLLKNLEGMVESARDEESQKAAAAGTEAKTETAPAAPSASTLSGPIPEPSSAADAAAPAAAPGTATPATAGSEMPAATEAPATAPSALPESRPERNSMAALDSVPRTRPSVADMPAAKRKTVPVPITFVFNEASFTDEGRRAASLLLEYLQLKHYDHVTLTGHADERGTDSLNMDLSRERLEAVASLLKDGGYSGRLDLVPKGETEPFTGVVRSEYDQEDLWQLDRRVELIISN